MDTPPPLPPTPDEESGQHTQDMFNTIRKNETIRAVNDSMLDGLGQLADYFGYNKVMGMMYGALLLSPQPMSLDDMMAHLDVSKASVSMNLRMLENLGIVREVWVRGDRRKYYEAESDFGKILTNVLGSRELRDVNQALEVIDNSIANLREAVSTMSQNERALAEHYVTSIDQMKDFFRFAKLILTSILDRDKRINVGEVRQINIE
jgi:HTH-type transcriptional regulator, glycine betaine synthesis regulator